MKKKNPKSAYATEVSTEIKTSPSLNLSEEQIQALCRLLNQGANQSGSSNPQSSASIAVQGKSKSYSLITKRLPKNVWIVDTGASDHMSCAENLMTDYTPCHSSINISMTDGTTSLALGIGTICVSKLRLQSVLHVPGIKYNLLSVNKLTTDMGCSVTFFPSHCIFQDQASRKMIGSARMIDGLYYLAGDIPNSSHNKAALNVTADDKVLLWHQRLGHPNFPYLKSLYPEIFINKDQVFSCQQCTIAKQHRSHHSIQSYKPSKPFHLIHSDIWGPSKCPNVNGFR